jgi:hypothetical protein
LPSDSHYRRDAGDSDPECGAIIENHQERKQGRLSSSESHENHPRDTRVQRLWLWEILSITAAALALAGIVLIPVLHRCHPFPKWSAAITINALIAIFTAIFMACMMMPVAEFIGQLKWLWYQNSRPLGQMERWDVASRCQCVVCLLSFSSLAHMITYLRIRICYL